MTVYISSSFAKARSLLARGDFLYAGTQASGRCYLCGYGFVRGKRALVEGGSSAEVFALDMVCFGVVASREIDEPF